MSAGVHDVLLDSARSWIRGRVALVGETHVIGNGTYVDLFSGIGHCDVLWSRWSGQVSLCTAHADDRIR